MTDEDDCSEISEYIDSLLNKELKDEERMESVYNLVYYPNREVYSAFLSVILDEGNDHDLRMNVSEQLGYIAAVVGFRESDSIPDEYLAKAMDGFNFIKYVTPPNIVLEEFITVNKKRFPISEAYIREFMNDNGELTWTLEIAAERFPEIWSYCAPVFKYDYHPARYGPLKSLQNRTIDEPRGAIEEDLDLFHVYIFEHNNVYENKINFGAIANGKISIHWTGKCDIYCGPEYDTEVPFEIVAQLEVKQGEPI